MLDWPSLQPQQGTPANLEHPYDGCLRGTPPCAGWAGVKDQLAALASRQKQHKGGWEVLVVITGTPEWAARPASGCERSEHAAALARAEVLRHGRLSQARQGRDRGRRRGRRRPALLERLERAQPPVLHLAPARRLRAVAQSLAVKRYAELTRNLKRALDEAPGDQQYVLGELAGLDESKT